MHQSLEFRHDLKKAFIATIPVLCGYAFLGFGFGVILSSKGFGSLWALLLSGTTISGAMQYISCELLEKSVPFITMAYTTLLVNLRYMFYGFSMIDRYRDLKAKPFLIFTLTDETFSLLCNENQIPEVYSKKRYYLLVSLLDYLYWVLSSFVGCLVGGILPFDTTGIDYVLTALFLTIVVEQWGTTKDHKPVISGIVISLLCLFFFGADYFLLPGMALIIAYLLVFDRKKEDALHE